MADHYPIAAFRHYADAVLLDQNDRMENALCHYAFSAECAIKAIYNWICGKSVTQKVDGHDVDRKVWVKATDNLDLLCAFYPKLSQLLSFSLPGKLFDTHPDRRYADAYPCTRAELNECAAFVMKLRQVLLLNLLDGDY